MAYTNLLKPVTSPNGEMYLFSNYANDLTRQNTSPEEYRVVPSKFAALELNAPTVEEYSTYDIGNRIGIAFQNYYENSLAYFRQYDWTNEEHPVSEEYRFRKYWLNRMLWATMLRYGMITTEHYSADDDADIYYFPELHYIGDINIYSTQKQDGVNYNEIYCYIPNTARDTYYNVLLMTPDGPMPIDDEDYTKSIKYDIPNQSLVGWSDINDPDHPRNYPQNTSIPCVAQVDEVNGENALEFFTTDWIRPEELEPGDEPSNQDHHSTNKVWDPMDPNADHDHTKFNVNTIVLFYDIKRIDADGNIITEYKNIPMGIYFTGVEGFDSYSNVIEKYVSHTDIHGQGSSYALRVCNRYVTTQTSTMFIDSVTDMYDGIANLSDVLSSFGEVIDTMNDVIAENQTFRNEVSDHLAQFKNYRTNVPYIRRIKDIRSGQEMGYWFVNGRNTGHPAGFYTVANVNTQANFLDHDPESPGYIQNVPGYDAQYGDVPAPQFDYDTDSNTWKLTIPNYTQLAVRLIQGGDPNTPDPRAELSQGTYTLYIPPAPKIYVYTVDQTEASMIQRTGDGFEYDLNIPGHPGMDIYYDINIASPICDFNSLENKYVITLPDTTPATHSLMSRGPYVDRLDLVSDVNNYNGNKRDLIDIIGRMTAGSTLHVVYDVYETLNNRFGDYIAETNFNYLYTDQNIRNTTINEELFGMIVGKMKQDTHLKLTVVPCQEDAELKGIGFEFYERGLWSIIDEYDRTHGVNSIYFMGHLTHMKYDPNTDESKFIVSKGYYDIDDIHNSDMGLAPAVSFDIYKSYNNSRSAYGASTVQVYVTEYNMNHLIKTKKYIRTMYDDYHGTQDVDFLNCTLNNNTGNESYMIWHP